MKTLFAFVLAAGLAGFGQDGFDEAMRQSMLKRNGMTPEQLAEYLPWVHPLVTEPVAEGISLAVPPEPTLRSLAELGIVDATSAPFGADPNGERDSTRAIQAAVDFARDHQMVVFLRPGTYRISDTIECRQKLAVRLNGRIHGAAAFPNVLLGSAVPGRRTVLRLDPRSPGFTDPARRKIVVHFTNCNYGYDKRDYSQGPLCPQANINYNQVFTDIDIVIGEGNAGAIGIRMQAAEGSTIQNVTIDATHGHTGMQGAAGSGGSHHNLTIVGGRVGIDTRGFPPEFKEDGTGTQPTPTLAHVALLDQTEAALINKSRGPLVGVGWHIRSALVEPVIRLERDWPAAPFNSGLALIDSIVEFTGAPGQLCAPTKSFYLRNVYLRNAATVAPEIGGEPSGWLRIEELAYPVAPQPFREFRFTESVWLDGQRSDQPLLRREAGAAPPPDLRSRHIWAADSPTWQSRGAVNVKAAPYHAAGDGVTDDTAALQRAIDEHEIVFLPKGYYRISNTLRLQPRTKLVGLAHHLSTIMTRAPFGALAEGDTPKPLVETADTAEADTVLAFVGIRLFDDAPAEVVEKHGGNLPFYALSWRCGGSSMVRSPEIARGRLHGYTLRPLPEMGRFRYAAPAVRISGHGGGRWYNFFIHGLSQETEDYRHILVEDIPGPLAFYHLHAQHADSFAQCEFRRSANVDVYGVKSEYQTRFLLARDSSGIRIFGHGGNATAFRGSAHYVFADCADITLTNMSENVNVRRTEPEPMPYREHPAEPYGTYYPIVAIRQGVETPVPHTDSPILWRIGGK